MTRAVVGRESEFTTIDAFLDRVPDGPRVLIIEGGPGVGKTTLWLESIERAAARSWRTLTAHPTDVEATFGYAALGDLLVTLIDEELAVLPDPQRRAMRVALLRDEPRGRAPDPLSVAVAFLNVLRHLAERGPLLVAVDDIQWLDPASALALNFAIRRVRNEPVGILLASRSEIHASLPGRLGESLADDQLRRVVVPPLDLASTRALLEVRLGLPVPNPTLRRIHGVSGGNPLFALELGTAILDAGGDLPATMDLPVRQELLTLVTARLAALPVRSQDALAVAAMILRPTVELIDAVVSGSTARLLRPAVAAGIIEVNSGAVRFTHPLRATAARSLASTARTREIHARLASLLSDQEERARHLALAATEPDELASAALEAAARVARARGAPDAAIELMGLAVRLTPADQFEALRRRRRLEVWFGIASGGDLQQARVLAEASLASSPPGPERVEALWTLGLVYLNGMDWRLAAAALQEAIAEGGDDDAVRARCESALTCVLDQLGLDFREALQHGYAELDAAERLGDDVHIATALGGIARNEQRLTGRVPDPLIKRALGLEPIVMQSDESLPTWPSVAFAEMLSWTDDFEQGLGIWDWLIQHARDRGEEGSLIEVLTYAIRSECEAGLWDKALLHATEGLDLARAAGAVASLAIITADRALVEAHVGDVAAVRYHVEEATRFADATGALRASRIAARAMGLLELSLGAPAAAHSHLAPLIDGRRDAGVLEPGELPFVTDDIEALIATDRIVEATALLDWFEDLAERSERHRQLAACQRCRGLLSAATGDLEAAFACLERSVATYQRASDPFGLARSQLALGAVHRRAHRKRAARDTLQEALSRFELLGARIWADTCRRELERIGGRQSGGSELTATERQVAALVAQGRTNREVAVALFLTVKTVEGYLSQIYAKLAVRSRTELAHHLASVVPPSG